MLTNKLKTNCFCNLLNPVGIQKIFKKAIKKGIFSADFDNQFFAGRFQYLFSTGKNIHSFVECRTGNIRRILI